MKILGLSLRTPGLSDLPMVVLTLVLAIAITGFAMRFLGWDIAQASAALFGAAGAALALASGVSVKDHGVRGAIVVAGFSVVSVLAALAVHALLK